ADDAASRAALARYTQLEEPELLAETIAHSRAIMRRDGRPSRPGLQAILDDLAETGPRPRTIRPGQIVNPAAPHQVAARAFPSGLRGVKHSRRRCPDNVQPWIFRLPLGTSLAAPYTSPGGAVAVPEPPASCCRISARSIGRVLLGHRQTLSRRAAHESRSASI